ncbi:sugar phosphate isomerase/epimerase family protein [Pseudarthrobacter sp. N5]|uniref:sugar phosphate isomerase/epimerase family protein n=1 Tax=Pseudarthrobacter sp. N5 TaxID=3418416 RepID=UPI003CF8BE90
MTLAPSPELSEWTMPILTTGICSVTLRDRAIEDVAAAASAADLAGIEWGTDVHIRDAASADQARELTAAADLQVLSLGSYYRVGSLGDFDALVSLAARLGARRIRVWAGEAGSAESDDVIRASVVEDAQRIAGLAASHGLDIAFEYHGGTLTDSVESTLKLMEEVDRPNVGTYWQPAVGLSDQEAIASIHRVIRYVRGVHCFSWWPQRERLPLAGRRQLRQSIADILREHGRPTDILLEFVADDLPENVLRDAAFLNFISLGED